MFLSHRRWNSVWPARGKARAEARTDRARPAGVLDAGHRNRSPLNAGDGSQKQVTILGEYAPFQILQRW